MVESIICPQMEYSLSLHQHVLHSDCCTASISKSLRNMAKSMRKQHISLDTTEIMQIVREWICLYKNEDEKIDIDSICCAAYVFNSTYSYSSNTDTLLHALCKNNKRVNFTEVHSIFNKMHNTEKKREIETSDNYALLWSNSINNEIRSLLVHFECTYYQRMKMKNECKRVVELNSDAILYAPKYIAASIIMKELKMNKMSTSVCEKATLSRSKLSKIKNTLYNF